MTTDYLVINKNRGWRGLAEVVWKDSAGTVKSRLIFSFSPQLWKDLMDGYIVLHDMEHYYVIHFEDMSKLPKPTQQRSVLIKHAYIGIKEVTQYDKTTWVSDSMKHGHYDLITHFTRNRNNHTTSDWNCIGLRVSPMI